MDIRELVFAELDTAIKENGYMELLTMDPVYVAQDMLTCSPAVEHVTDEEIIPFIIEYQALNKA